MESISGGCLCNAVRVVASGQPYRVGLCHCLDCRKHTGSVFHPLAIYPEDAVRITGETRSFGNRHFCPECGSTVFSRYGDEVEIGLGSLDAPNQLVPTYENWTIRREDWLPPFDLAHRYSRDREGTGRYED